MAEKSQAIYELYGSEVFQNRVGALCGQKAQKILKGQDTPSAEETTWAQHLLGMLITSNDYIRAMAVEMDPTDAQAVVEALDTAYQTAFDVIHPICIAARVANGTLKSDSPQAPAA